MAAPLIIRLADRFNEICEKHGMSYYGGGQSYEHAKWTIIPLMVDRLWDEVEKRAASDGEIHRSYTPRPYNGCWDIIGYEQADLPHIDFVGLHTMDFDGTRRCQYCFGQYKYQYKSILAKSPSHLTPEETKALHKVAFGDCGSCELKLLNSLGSYGYIARCDNGYKPCVVAIDDVKVNECRNAFTDAERSELHSLAEELIALFAEYKEKGCAFFLREWICGRAVDCGVLKYDKDFPKYAGAYIYK